MVRLSELVYCISYIYAVWHFLDRKKEERRFGKAVYIIAMILLFLVSVLMLQREKPILYAGTGVVIICLISYLLFERTKVAFIRTLLFSMVLFGSYLIIVMLLTFLGFGYGTSVIYTLYRYFFLLNAGGFLILATEYIFISRYFVKIFREKEKVSLSNFQTVVFLVSPFLILAVLIALYINGDIFLMLYGYGAVCAMILIIIVIHFLIIYSFSYMIDQQRKHLDYRLYEQQNKMMMHQYEELEEKYQASRKVIHDVKNHMHMLGELYHSGDLEAADQYCRDIDGMLRSLERVIYTDNRMLNLILNEKLNIQELKGVKLQIHINEADVSFMRDIDLTTVFTNLLDNAKEAASETKEGAFISLKIDRIREFLVICLENSCPEQEKEKKGHMGVGLENVRRVIRIYHGTMQAGKTEKGYCVNISIPIEREGKS